MRRPTEHIVHRPQRVAIALLLIAVAIALTLSIVHVSRRQRILQLGYELARTSAQARAAEEEHRRLRVERSLLRHPDRIERLAKNLGLTRLEPSQLRMARLPEPTHSAESASASGPGPSADADQSP